MRDDDYHIPSNFEQLCDFIESLDLEDVRPGSRGWTEELMQYLIRWTKKYAE